MTWEAPSQLVSEPKPISAEVMWHFQKEFSKTYLENFFLPYLISF
jgi:hypothetical protein